MVSPSISIDASFKMDRRSVVSLKEMIVAPSYRMAPDAPSANEERRAAERMMN